MRITQKMLDGMINRLNTATGNNPVPWSNGKPNIGNFHTDSAYGGVALYQMISEGGGVNDISRFGHVSKRELYNYIRAFLDGLEYAKTGDR